MQKKTKASNPPYGNTACGITSGDSTAMWVDAAAHAVDWLKRWDSDEVENTDVPLDTRDVVVALLNENQRLRSKLFRWPLHRTEEDTTPLDENEKQHKQHRERLDTQLGILNGFHTRLQALEQKLLQVGTFLSRSNS